MSLNLSTDNGKAPAQEPAARVARNGPRPLVKVQPARMDDLQPHYAQTIQHSDDNPEAHSWYAGMSK